MAKKEPPYGYPLDASLNRGRPAPHHHHQGIGHKAEPHPADDEDFDSRCVGSNPGLRAHDIAFISYTPLVHQRKRYNNNIIWTILIHEFEKLYLPEL